MLFTVSLGLLSLPLGRVLASPVAACAAPSVNTDNAATTRRTSTAANVTTTAKVSAASSVVNAANSTTTVTVASAVNTATCGGKNYVYKELAGYGKLPSDARDKYGDTIGGIGSSIALDKKSSSFKKNKGKNGVYEGIIYGLPDRGWNTQGTQNTQTRIHKFRFTFETVEATINKPASPNFQLTYLDTLLLTGPDGTPLTGLDATGTVKYDGFPTLPFAKCTLSMAVGRVVFLMLYRYR